MLKQLFTSVSVNNVDIYLLFGKQLLLHFISYNFIRTLVLIAIQDDGSKRMITSAYDALINIGVDNPLRNSFQSSFAYVGWIGVKQRKCIEQV